MTAFPKPVKRPPRARKPLRAKRMGVRRKVAGPRPSDALAYPKPRREKKTAHARRAREMGRMAFYSHLWCMLRELANSGNAEPRHQAEWLACKGRIEVAHLGDRGGTGTGGWRRAPDAKTAPLCQKHHRSIDGTVGGRARWYVELGREGQQELREKLVLFAGYYWDGLAPEGRQHWNDRAAEQATQRSQP